jgi:hypothetical protein
MNIDGSKHQITLPDLLEGHVLGLEFDYPQRNISLYASDRSHATFKIRLKNTHYLMLNIAFGSDLIDYCKIYDGTADPKIIRDMVVAVLSAESRQDEIAVTINNIVDEVLSNRYAIFECIPIGGTDFLAFAEEISVEQIGVCEVVPPGSPPPGSGGNSH